MGFHPNHWQREKSFLSLDCQWVYEAGLRAGLVLRVIWPTQNEFHGNIVYFSFHFGLFGHFFLFVFCFFVLFLFLLFFPLLCSGNC